jgi:hypothetical protein
MNNLGYELYAEICNMQYYNFTPYVCETEDAYSRKIKYIECLKTKCSEFSDLKMEAVGPEGGRRKLT